MNFTNDDPFARYRPPIIEIAHTNSNGGTTTIANLAKLGTSLERPPKQLFSYFQKELATAGTLKKAQLHGSFTQEQMQSLLIRFIERYVTCPVCKNPETVLHGGDAIKCKSCGAISKTEH